MKALGANIDECGSEALADMWRSEGFDTDNDGCTQPRSCDDTFGETKQVLDAASLVMPGPKVLKAGPCNSFLPDTEVQMADGTTRPIQDLEPGDQILATNPDSGETGPRTILATITTEDDKDFADVTVKTDTGDASIVATANHPFWIASEWRWINAGDLKPGQWLRTSTGTWVQAGAVRVHHQAQRTHNLTVDTDHTYYVGVGSENVLVHNSGPCDGTGIAAAERAADAFDYPGGATGAVHSPSQGWLQSPLSSGSRNINPQVRGNPAPGTIDNFEHHLEAQTAALMRQHGIQEATLYINFRSPSATRQVCSPCNGSLPDMLPQGASLSVVFRNRDGTIFRSQPYIGNSN